MGHFEYSTPQKGGLSNKAVALAGMTIAPQKTESMRRYLFWSELKISIMFRFRHRKAKYHEEWWLRTRKPLKIQAFQPVSKSVGNAKRTVHHWWAVLFLLWCLMWGYDRRGYEVDKRSSLGKADLRCRWQIQQRRFHRSGRNSVLR